MQESRQKALRIRVPEQVLQLKPPFTKIASTDTKGWLHVDCARIAIGGCTAQGATQPAGASPRCLNFSLCLSRLLSLFSS